MLFFMTKTIKTTMVLETKTATLVVLFLTKLLKNAVIVSKLHNIIFKPRFAICCIYFVLIDVIDNFP